MLYCIIEFRILKELMINSILKWSGCFLVIAGAICTSLRIDPLNIILLNMASICYLSWGYRIKEWNQVVVNVVLIVIYIIGLIG
jgi:hypothetical protein